MSQTKKTHHILNFQNFKIGLIVSLLVQPFEVIRTSSIMSLKNMNTGFSGTYQVIKQILQLEGLRGFFRGGLLGMGKSTLSAGLFFTGLENAHVITKEFRNIKYIPANVIDFFNACCTKAITTFIINPITVVKTRFEVVGVNEYTSIRHAVESIYQKEGMKGFYKGILTTLMRDVPFSGIQYSSYKFCLDIYKNYLNPSHNPFDSPLLISFIGAISGVYAVMLTYPFDNLRVRLQCYDMSNLQIKGLFDLIRQIYREEGIKGYYLGYLPRLMKKAASSALTWTLYESVRKDSVIH